MKRSVKEDEEKKRAAKNLTYFLPFWFDYLASASNQRYDLSNETKEKAADNCARLRHGFMRQFFGSWMRRTSIQFSFNLFCMRLSFISRHFHSSNHHIYNLYHLLFSVIQLFPKQCKTLHTDSLANFRILLHFPAWLSILSFRSNSLYILFKKLVFMFSFIIKCKIKCVYAHEGILIFGADCGEIYLMHGAFKSSKTRELVSFFYCSVVHAEGNFPRVIFEQSVSSLVERNEKHVKHKRKKIFTVKERGERRNDLIAMNEKYEIQSKTDKSNSF